MKFVLPLPPNMSNSRWHWRTKYKKQFEYELRCLHALGHAEKTLERATISAHLFLYSYMDVDNAMARLKWPVDLLVKHGYIADDSRKVLTWSGLPEQTIDRKNPRLEITLEAA